MRESIVVDGERRFKQTAEFAARLRQARAAVREQYAGEMARAGRARRWWLRLRIAMECRKVCRRLTPSRESMYLRGGSGPNSKHYDKTVA